MERNKQKFFNGLAGNWDGNDKVSPEKYRTIVNKIDVRDGQRILDVGTGTGVIIPYILESAGKESEIHSIDYAEDMIKAFKNKSFPQNVKSHVMDIHETSFKDGFFDRVIANACYPHFKSKDIALREIFRLLKKQGMFIISHPTGRRFVNNLHRKSNPLIKGDIILDINVLLEFVENFGFEYIDGCDEEEFFYAVFRV